MERALQAACPDFYIDADLIILRGGYPQGIDEDAEYGDELECGQIRYETFAEPALLTNRGFFLEWIAEKDSRDYLTAILDRAKALISIQLLNADLWWDNEPKRTLRPLQDWLIETFDGVLYVEGGEFVDRNGLVA